MDGGIMCWAHHGAQNQLGCHVLGTIGHLVPMGASHARHTKEPPSMGAGTMTKWVGKNFARGNHTKQIFSAHGYP